MTHYPCLKRLQVLLLLCTMIQCTLVDLNLLMPGISLASFSTTSSLNWPIFERRYRIPLKLIINGRRWISFYSLTLNITRSWQNVYISLLRIIPVFLPKRSCLSVISNTLLLLPKSLLICKRWRSHIVGIRAIYQRLKSG